MLTDSLPADTSAATAQQPLDDGRLVCVREMLFPGYEHECSPRFIDELLQ